MGHEEAVVTQKSGKALSPPKDHPAPFPYLDWSAMQAYYGPGIMPPTYFGAGIAPGHAPPAYMWGPQPLLPSAFGKPYTAVYPHGGGFTHPFMPLMVNPLSAEPATSVNSKDKSINKKLKEIDGTAVSTGSGNSEKTSGDCSAEGSSDGHNQKESGTPKKRSLDDRPRSVNKKALDISPGVEIGGTSRPNDTLQELGKPITLPNLCIPVTAIKTDVSITSDFEIIGSPVSSGVPSKDDKESKRERRKQSNRESARRSRLRKQAETEDLARKVELLSAENTSLRREISRLAESSKKLSLENSSLMEKLTEAGPDQAQDVLPDQTAVQSARAVENFLSMIDNTSTSRRSSRHMEHGSPKLRRLLSSGLATDAVAAS